MTIKFNGISKPFFHATVDTERPMWAPIEWDMVEIPGRPGAYPKQKKVKARPLSVSVVIKGVDDMEKAKEEVAEWLVTDEAKPLSFLMNLIEHISRLLMGKANWMMFLNTEKEQSLSFVPILISTEKNRCFHCQQVLQQFRAPGAPLPIRLSNILSKAVQTNSMWSF